LPTSVRLFVQLGQAAQSGQKVQLGHEIQIGYGIQTRKLIGTRILNLTIGTIILNDTRNSTGARFYI
jgi:hypothetical protein